MTQSETLVDSYARAFDEAEALVRRLIDAEGAAIRAGDTHPMPSPSDLHPSVAEGWRAMPCPTRAAEARVLFKLELFDHPEVGRWVAAVLSQRTTAARGLGKFELLLALHGDPLRVGGIWSVCTACVALGIDGQGASCLECAGLGWDPWHGTPADELGRSLSVRRVTRPASSHYKPAYRRGPS